MTQFRYEAVDPTGAVSRGQIDARDESDARNKLRQQSLLPVAVDPLLKRAPVASGRPIPGSKGRISAATLSRISRQLASLVANDIRVEDALAAIARQGLPKTAAASLLGARKQIVEGRSFAEALTSQGNLYPKPFVAAIAAGEASGRLDVVLDHLARHTERDWANRQTIQFALIYPAFLAIVSGLIISLLLTNVVPDILAVYQRRGTDLPLATDILISISRAVRQWGVPVLILLALAGVAGRWALSKPGGELAAAKWALEIPIFGSFQARRHAAQMATTLAMLVQSGVPLVRALRISASVSGNVHVRTAMQAAANDVSEGTALDTALSRTGFMPPMMLSMISGAVRSGQLGETLDWAGRDEQASLDQKMKALVALLEPVILLIMGGVILFIVLAILTPITRLNSLTGV